MWTLRAIIEDQMEKTCIFCGNHPRDKNKEHVIPKWLIELTGDPKRQFQFGPFYSKSLKMVNFSADQFTFPSCSNCNEEFSLLESNAKKVIENILSSNPIENNEINLLMTWLDKVRIGLWLGNRYLDKDYFGIEPHFYIKQRIERYDRVLLIYKIKSGNDGINFGGTNSPIFSFMPSCYVLRINRTILYNISSLSLVAKRLGFPFTANEIMLEDGKTEVVWNEGSRKIMIPVIRDKFPKTNNYFMQAINKDFIQDENYFSKETIEYFHKNEIRNNSGVSVIYNGNDGRIIPSKVQIEEFNIDVDFKKFYTSIVKDCWKRQEILYSNITFGGQNTDLRCKRIFEKNKIIKLQRFITKRIT